MLAALMSRPTKAQAEGWLRRPAAESRAACARALTLVEQKGQLDSGDLTARTIEPIAEDFASQDCGRAPAGAAAWPLDDSCVLM